MSSMREGRVIAARYQLERPLARGGMGSVWVARHLQLDSTRAGTLLVWRPRWRLQRALDFTVDWHRAWVAGMDMRLVCQSQIEAYRRDALT